jgi:hypothetical protein
MFLNQNADQLSCQSFLVDFCHTIKDIAQKVPHTSPFVNFCDIVNTGWVGIYFRQSEYQNPSLSASLPQTQEY